MKHRRLLIALTLLVAGLWTPSMLDGVRFRQTDEAHAPAFISDYRWVALGHVAHAFGSGWYRNSRSAFEASYARGYRVFEVDLAFTSDGHLVVNHGWRNPPTRRDFIEADPKDALTLDDLFALVAAHPDIWLILDPKDEPVRVWTAVAAAGRARSDALDRMVPQLLHPADYGRVLDIHPFRSLVFTTSRLPWWSATVVDWAHRHRVRVITIPHQSADRSLVDRMTRNGGWVYAQPVNDCRTVAELRRLGVHRVYSGLLSPDPAAC